MIEHTTAGQMSLAELADGHKSQPSTILRLTAEHSPGGAYPANVAAYINGVFRGTIATTDHMLAGLHFYNELPPLLRTPTERPIGLVSTAKCGARVDLPKQKRATIQIGPL
jgi:hypothetical protein